MTRLRIAALLGALVLYPAAAQAQDDSWWYWIQQLSGPGPFLSVRSKQLPLNLELRFACGASGADTVHPFWEKFGDKGKERLRCLLNDDLTTYVAVNYHGAATGDQNQFNGAEPNQRSIGARAWEGIVRHRFHPAFDAGAGAGVIQFFGDTFDTKSYGEIIPISVIIRPGALAGTDPKHMFFGIRLEETYRFGTITSQDLGGPPGIFQTGGEWSFRWGIVTDFGVLFR